MKLRDNGEFTEDGNKVMIIILFVLFWIVIDIGATI